MSSELACGGLHANQPIFIQGITARSGTNYLAHLLRLHPHCAGAYPEFEDYKFEDYFLPEAYRLFEFAHAVKDHWGSGLGERERDELLYCLGNGLISFLTQHLGARRVVTKTPSIKGLSLFFRLFPTARLIVLVRDGRAVTESMLKTFDIPYETAMRRWVKAADGILTYDQTHKHSENRYLLVRYEDLLTDLRGQMGCIFKFAGLPEDLYDFDAAAAAPVIGSSSMKNEAGRITWKPQPKQEGFDPLKRFSHWPNYRHARFNWIAGRQSEALGYPWRQPGGSRFLWRCYNVMTDLRVYAVNLWRKLQQRKARQEMRRQRRAFRQE